MNFLSWIGSQPWLMTPQALEALTETARANPSAVRDRSMPDMPGTPTNLIGQGLVRMNGSTAIVAITGVLYHSEEVVVDEFMSALFGGTSYESIAAAVNAAANNRDVESILLYINSPGGMVSGCSETAGIIKAAAARKKTVAYASGMMCSSAYWIGSSADSIVTESTAALGSIGVIASIVDSRGALEKLGSKLYTFVAKQSPHKLADPATEKGRIQIQASVDAIGELFVRAVASNRNVSVAKVLSDFGGGDVLHGAEAVKVGLADRQGTMASVLGELQGTASGRRAAATSSGAPASVTGTRASAPVAAQPTASDLEQQALLREINASEELRWRLVKAMKAVAAHKIDLGDEEIEPGMTARELIEKVERAVAEVTAPGLFDQLYGQTKFVDSPDGKSTLAYAERSKDADTGYASTADRNADIDRLYGRHLVPTSDSADKPVSDAEAKALYEKHYLGKPDFEKVEGGFASKEELRAYVWREHHIKID